MRPTIRSLLRDKPFVLNGYVTMPGAFSAEIYARQGWDTITIDLQHGLIGYADAVGVLQAVASTGVVPLVRASWLDPSAIMKMLDAGALGVTCPMISTADEARQLVSYCRYPPAGIRSMGPIRAGLIDGPTYAQSANSSVNVFAMIETKEGLENIEDIVEVEGLDGIYIGLNDLALSMGRDPKANPSDPEIERAIDRIVGLCARRQLIAGVMASTPEGALAFAARGFRFITLSSDANALALQARAWVESFRSLANKAE